MASIIDYIETAQIKATTLYSKWGQSYRTHDIQDLTQELLVVAWLAMGTFDSAKDASLKTWINRKMDYYIQEFVRQQKTRKVHIEYVGDLYDLHQYVEEYHQARRIIFDRELSSVYEQLTPKQKTILRYKIDGYTHAEIAEKMGYRDNSAVAHQWKDIVKLIIKAKINEEMADAAHSPSLMKEKEKEIDTAANPQEYYFNQFWKNLPQNKKKSASEDTENK